MPKVLKGPAVGPDGDRFKAGQTVPAHWPDWFVDDLDTAVHLVDDNPPPTKTTKPRDRKGSA